LKKINKTFEGYINLTTREEKTIGYLKVSIQKSNKKFVSSPELNNQPLLSSNKIIGISEKIDSVNNIIF